MFVFWILKAGHTRWLSWKPVCHSPKVSWTYKNNGLEALEAPGHKNNGLGALEAPGITKTIIWEPSRLLDLQKQ